MDDITTAGGCAADSLTLGGAGFAAGQLGLGDLTPEKSAAATSAAAAATSPESSYPDPTSSKQANSAPRAGLRSIAPWDLMNWRTFEGSLATVLGRAGSSKYFVTTPQQASNFARMVGDKAYTITSVKVTPSQLARGQPINPAREGAGRYFPTPRLPNGRVNVFNQSVLP